MEMVELGEGWGRSNAHASRPSQIFFANEQKDEGSCSNHPENTFQGAGGAATVTGSSPSPEQESRGTHYRKSTLQRRGGGFSGATDG